MLFLDKNAVSVAYGVTSGVNFTQNQRFEFPYDV
jgi:hypothetical protein